METKPTKSLTMAIVLTIIPITDMLGANWFYLGRTKMGIAKVAVFLLYIVVGILLSGDVGAMLGWMMFFMLVMVVWWIVDIPLIASGRVKPRP